MTGEIRQNRDTTEYIPDADSLRQYNNLIKEAVKICADGYLQFPSHFIEISYSFTDMQAQSVKFLWEQREKGCPEVSEKTIGDKIESSSDKFRLFDILRMKKIILGHGKT